MYVCVYVHVYVYEYVYVYVYVYVRLRACVRVCMCARILFVCAPTFSREGKGMCQDRRDLG